MGFQIKTARGYDFGEATSAMQKAIRRNDARIAGYFAVELFESGMAAYVWKRLLTISAEDCAGIITQEIESLRQGFLVVNADRKKDEKFKGRIFVAKAVLILCQHPKSRDADHLTNLVHDQQSQLPDSIVETYLAECRKDKEEIPDYAFDCHTREGKRRGKTKEQFFKEEHAALSPRVPGLFDADVEKGLEFKK
jgi:replication-associated recombination protein RarA